MTIGVISDTHGVLRSEAREALRGSDLILHAGDLGSAEVLRDLQRIAPVVAVRGNVDVEAWHETCAAWRLRNAPENSLPSTPGTESEIEAGGGGIGRGESSGHSHRPAIGWLDGVRYSMAARARADSLCR